MFLPLYDVHSLHHIALVLFVVLVFFLHRTLLICCTPCPVRTFNVRARFLVGGMPCVIYVSRSVSRLRLYRGIYRMCMYPIRLPPITCNYRADTV